MISFSNIPFALITLTAIPALITIYFFRSTFKKHYVSSLILWQNQKRTSKGGRRLRHIKTPLSFFLELIIFLFIFIAAAKPFYQIEKQVKPLVIILDDSVSMRAGKDGKTPQRKAQNAIIKELKKDNYAVRFILAGKRPKLIKQLSMELSVLKSRMNEWACRSLSSDLNKAIGMAKEISDKNTLILVITDHAPENLSENQAHIKWWAFGEKQPNVGFVNAKRIRREKHDRYFLEAANYSDKIIQTEISVGLGSKSGIQRKSLRLRPHEIKQLIFDLAAGNEVFHARIKKDVLRADNEVFLVSQEKKPLGVLISIADENLDPLIRKTINVTGMAKIGAQNSDIIFTDDASSFSENNSAWIVRILKTGKTKAFVGPFVVDTSHPLTEGLFLEGVIWGAVEESLTKGAPVITAGNIFLLNDFKKLNGQRELIVNFDLRKSTLQNTNNWPTLIWNILNWRKKELSGLVNSNVTPEIDAVLNVKNNINKVIIIDPEGKKIEKNVQTEKVFIASEKPGIYKIYTDKVLHMFASNMLSPDESNLENSSTGRWGSWSKSAYTKQDFSSISWIFIFSALLVLLLHSMLVSKQLSKD